MIQAHPLIGIGLGNFKAAMPEYSEPGITEYHIAHNMFIEVGAELGIPALAFFLSVFVCTFQGLERVRRTAPLLFIREVATALQSAVVGVGVAGCFVSAEYQKTTWVGFALVACLLPLARNLQPVSRALPQSDAISWGRMKAARVATGT